jgi:glycine betaine/choline ABC-type transport system substrate-binding protein
LKKQCRVEQKGTDKGGSFVTVVRLETELRATLTEQQIDIYFRYIGNVAEM